LFSITQKYNCSKTNKKIKVKERNIFSINPNEISSISIEISILNKFCSDEFLISILNWVKKWDIDIEFSLGDMLHRYNIYTHYLHTTGKLLESSHCDILVERMRKEWFEKNLKIINQELNGYKFKINKWEDWLVHSKYKEVYNLLEDYVYSSNKHTLELERDIQRVSKKPLWLTGQDIEEKKKFLIQYMFEEITVYCLQNINTTTLHIYPGGSSFLLKSLHSDEKCPLPLDNRKYINFTFRGEGQNSYQDLSDWLKIHE